MSKTTSPGLQPYGGATLGSGVIPPPPAGTQYAMGTPRYFDAQMASNPVTMAFTTKALQTLQAQAAPAPVAAPIAAPPPPAPLKPVAAPPVPTPTTDSVAIDAAAKAEQTKRRTVGRRRTNATGPLGLPGMRGAGGGSTTLLG